MSGKFVCPFCKRPLEGSEKDTSSGRVMRTYSCKPCGFKADADEGKALWELLHEENERREDEGGKER